MNISELLLECIEGGSLLGEETFQGLNLDAALSGRDDRRFEDRWMDLFERVKDVQAPDGEAQRINVLREAAFRTVYRWCSDGDLSAYVSDDFEVIAKGAIEVPDDEFLRALVESYVDGRIPGGELSTPERSLSAILEQLRH